MPWFKSKAGNWWFLTQELLDDDAAAYPHLYKEKSMTKKERARRIAAGKAKAAADRATNAATERGPGLPGALDAAVAPARVSRKLVRITTERLYNNGERSTEVRDYNGVDFPYDS